MAKAGGAARRVALLVAVGIVVPIGGLAMLAPEFLYRFEFNL